MHKTIGSKNVLFIAFILSALIFIVDLNTELGVAGGVPYVIVIALGLLYNDKKYFIYAGSICVVLTFIGYSLSPVGGEYYKVFLNRFYAIASILVVSGMGYLILKRKEEFEKLKNNFNQRIKDELELSEVLSQRGYSSESDDVFNQAMQICLDNICRITQWPLGHLYKLSLNNNKLISTNIWSVQDYGKFKEFITITESTAFEKGIGLPGRVLEKGSMVFIPDVEFDSNFPRLLSINDIVVRGAFGVPIKLKGDIKAVLEFFSEKSEVPGEHIMELINQTTAQINLALEKWEYEKALINEKNKAEEANMAKSDFLSKMSHELRTPLNAILGFSQLLQLNSNNSFTKLEEENLEMVSSAGNHLLTLVNEILDLSSVESGEMSLTIETIDIIPIVDNVISILKTLAERENISLKYKELPTGSCYADLDPIRFKQIVFNLISNAIKYNNPNGLVVIYFEKPEPGVMRVGVKDTGRGIPDAKKEKLFQPFERFETEVKDIEGTGIGLTISKKLIEMMGGKIGYEKVPEGGSLFFLDLPISKKVPVKIYQETQSKPKPSKLRKNNSHQILYVEDIPANVELVKQIFSTRPDIKLTWASNAEVGIEIAQNQIPDLILMDIHLPGMDGVSAFKHLKTIQGFESVPVIALSADAMELEVNRALELGFAGYLTKPIEIDQFLEKIDEVLLNT